MFQSVTDILFSSAPSMQRGGANQALEASGDFEDLLASTDESPVLAEEKTVVDVANAQEGADAAGTDDKADDTEVSDNSQMPIGLVPLDQFVQKSGFTTIEIGALATAETAAIQPLIREDLAKTADITLPEPQAQHTSEKPGATPPVAQQISTKMAPLTGPEQPEISLLAKLLAPAKPVPEHVAQSDPAKPILPIAAQAEVTLPTTVILKTVAEAQPPRKLDANLHPERPQDTHSDISPHSDITPAGGSTPKAQDTNPAEPAPAQDEAPRATPEAKIDLLIDSQDASPVDISLHLSRETKLEGGGTQVAPPIRHALADPREISRHLAERLSNSEQNRVEVTLTPEELGKVRMVITPGDTPSVAVYADSRETLDFLRRNAELLSKELRDAGFNGASLSFGEGHERAPNSSRSGHYASREGIGGATDLAMTDEKPVPQQSYGRQIDMRV